MSDNMFYIDFHFKSVLQFQNDEEYDKFKSDFNNLITKYNDKNNICEWSINVY